jgi:hypothetical protein
MNLETTPHQPPARLALQPTLAARRRELQTTPSGGLRHLLSTSHKIKLGEGVDVLGAVMYLEPHTGAGRTVCPYSTPGCSQHCIDTTGRMVYDTHRNARVSKTKLFREFREEFMAQLRGEVGMHAVRARVLGMTPTIRLNGTSDLAFWQWEDEWLDPSVEGLRMVEYTKRPPGRGMLAALRRGWSFTFSWSDSPLSFERSLVWANHGVNTAVVVAGSPGSSRTVDKAVAAALVERGALMGRPVIDGDKHDARFLDPQVGGWTVLKAKGKAHNDRTGFVVRFNEDALLGTDRPAELCFWRDSKKEAA